MHEPEGSDADHGETDQRVRTGAGAGDADDRLRAVMRYEIARVVGAGDCGRDVRPRDEFIDCSGRPACEGG